ncbi:hypothetical protein MUK42_19296 [Musa troglodytarum]|uniref:DUF4378 domain-containing protein n=2 Tax=Musa troglodytarum TaxID=320322 RepID=A0A9E7G8W1_9LILI|nr:hypothetical protein MUK42_19296 [Musa troglodytarum]
MYYNSSRSCRREEPQPAVVYGRDQVWTDPVRSEGHFQSRKWPNASRIAFDSTRGIGSCAGKNSFALEISQKLSKKAAEIPMKEAIDEEEDIRCPAPSLVARLMGLDTLPSSVREWKNMEDCCKAITSKSTSVNCICIHPNDRSQFRSTDEKQVFKDVFEVTETSKIKKHWNHTNSRKMLGCRGNEAGMDPTNQNFRDAKCLSNHDLLQNGKTFNDAFEVSDLSKDLFLELLQDPNSFLAKHNVDLRHSPLSPHRSKITVLKPSKSIKHRSSEGWSESFTSERRPDRFRHMHQECTGSTKMKTASLGKHSIKENNVSLSHNLSASLHAARTRTSVHPARIVVLKPNLEKAQKIAEGDLFTNENSFISKKCREILASGIQELHDKDIQKFFFHTEVLSHKGSVEIAREITRKMRHTITSQTKKNFASQMNPYAKSGDSFIVPGIVKLNHPEAFYQSSDNFGEWSNSFSPSSSYSAESSASMEARKRLFERWKITHQFKNMKLCSQGSNTLGELLALSDRKTPKVTLDALDTKKFSNEKLTKDEILESKGYRLGISSKDGLKDGRSGLLPRFDSLPASSIVYGSPIPSDRKQVGGSSNDRIKEVLHMGSSVASEARCSLPGTAEVKSSRHHNHNSRLAHLVEEENMLPEREIHVNSEGLRKSIHVKNYLDNTMLHPEPTEYAITIRKSSASIPIVGDDSRRLTTREEQVMQSSFQVPSVQNDVVIEDISSDHPRVVQLQFEYDPSESLPLSFKGLELPSPVSVLETPSEEGSTTGCLERLSANLKELRMKLELLKLESVDAHMPTTDEDYTGGDHAPRSLGEINHGGFLDDDDRDFAYLLDIFAESGIHGVDDNKLSDACYLHGCPVDQMVFHKLEKKYDTNASWSRSERKLLFDLINRTLAGIITKCMDVNPGVRSRTHLRAWNREGLAEALWQMVVKLRKEQDCNQENKVLEPGWLGLRYDVDLIGREIERLLNKELLDELVSEFAGA